MKKMPVDGFRVTRLAPTLFKNHDVDMVTTFWDSRCNIIAEYYHYEGKVNYIISWGFDIGSLGASRKQKCIKKNMPYFSLSEGVHK